MDLDYGWHTEPLCMSCSGRTLSLWISSKSWLQKCRRKTKIWIVGFVGCSYLFYSKGSLHFFWGTDTVTNILTVDIWTNEKYKWFSWCGTVPEYLPYCSCCLDCGHHCIVLLVLVWKQSLPASIRIYAWKKSPSMLK